MICLFVERLNELGNQNKDYQNIINGITGEMKKQTIEIEELEASKGIAEEEAKQYRSQLNETEKTLAALQEHVDEINDKNRSLHEQLKFEGRGAKAERAKAKAEVERLVKNAVAHEEECHKMKAELQASGGAIAYLKRQAIRYDHANRNLQEQLNEASKKRKAPEKDEDAVQEIAEGAAKRARTNHNNSRMDNAPNSRTFCAH